jgi:hypothetical protein
MSTIASMLEHDRPGMILIDGAPLALCRLAPDVMQAIQDVCAAAQRVNLALVLMTPQAYSMPAPDGVSESWLRHVSNVWLGEDTTGATAGWLAAGGCHHVPDTAISTLRRQALFGTRSDQAWSFEAVNLV